MADGPKDGTVLHEAIQQGQWKDVMSRIKLVPQEAKYVCKTGPFSSVLALPLHQVCMRKPPAVLVSFLIATYPIAVKTRCNNNLPIHNALKYGAALDVIMTLLISYPDCFGEKDAEGNTPNEIFKNGKSAWNNETQALISTIMGGDVAKINLNDNGFEGEVSTEIVKSNAGTTGASNGKLIPELDDEDWKKEGLIVVVIGASGDLAKKKTYPSLLHLFAADLLPADVQIWGYARSNISHEELRAKIRPFIEKSGDASVIDAFLSCCFYKQGKSYGDQKAYQELATELSQYEAQFPVVNRLFYFAIPPNVFAEAGVAIKQSAMADKGWTRIIVEKPFGRDLASCEEILSILAKNFEEESLYRIDHYLGKEMVQNLLVLRFGNQWFERMWDRNSIQCVFLTFKEPFGTDGRGGYFDNFGIIRDIIQNHLLQVMTLLAMEAPTKVDGPEAGKSIRDAKVQVLKSMEPIQIEDCCLGQYEGYTDDETIKNKNTNTPTFAAIRCFVNNPRWAGVPFIFKAGKAMDERKAEMRIQFKDAPGSKFLFDDTCARNELVIRMQPDEAIYFKTNVKSPGFSSKPVQSELEVNYNTKFAEKDVGKLPDAYSRLILDVLRGRSAAFVREDELRKSWEIFTPVLHKIERENIRPHMYTFGSRGPTAANGFITKESGYIRNTEYVYNNRPRSLDAPKSSRAKKVSRILPSADGTCADVGLYGLAVMGQNFALNMASHGFVVCVGNRSPTKVAETVKRAKGEGNLPIIGSSDPADFIMKLKRPRKVILLVQAGKPVDLTIEAISKYMEPGDIIVDGGNEWYPNTIRRGTELEAKGILFVGMGISGGEEGARNGPSLMPGGPKKAYDELEPILTRCAAQVSDGACSSYVGPIGSGNYVKMVHNGIEYGDMQLIGEAYDIMKNVLGMTNDEMSQAFADWNAGYLESYLIEITAAILAKRDDVTCKGPNVISGVDKNKLVDKMSQALQASKCASYSQCLTVIKTASDTYNWKVDMTVCVKLCDIMRNIPGMSSASRSQMFADWKHGHLESYLIDITATILAIKDGITTKTHVVDYVLDKTGMKGTGKWTIQEAAEVLVAAPTISGSLNARFLSGVKDERVQASKILKGPKQVPPVERQTLVDKIGEALYASKICSYAQGLGIIKAASDKFNWNIDLAPCVKLWKGGCIIRAKLLDPIQAAFTKDPNLPNLMLNSSIADELAGVNNGWREVVITCALYGIACPSLGGSLTYYDSYRTESSPANLTQAHRDFFGGHTYERTDLPGSHHCKWTDAHKDIGNIAERTGGDASFIPSEGGSHSLVEAKKPVSPAAISQNTEMLSPQDELKKRAGFKAVDDYVRSGMVVGLGTGSTSYFAVERVGELIKSGMLQNIVAIPTSVRTKEQAERLGIPLVTLNTHSKLDVAIDGADNVDPNMNLVKGGGGALLREKMVEVCAKKFIVIVDESKLCEGLGPGFPVPVEIVTFCHEHTIRTVQALPSCAGCKPVLRMGSSSNNKVDGTNIAVTDNGNYIIDLHFKNPIKDAPKMADELKNTVGVVDHGIFCGLTTAVIMAGSDGIYVKKA